MLFHILGPSYLLLAPIGTIHHSSYSEFWALAPPPLLTSRTFTAQDEEVSCIMYPVYDARKSKYTWYTGAGSSTCC